MIFTEVIINNMFGITDAKLDLTYDRKSPYSKINQSLKHYPKINYKKINILMGPNASGKTSIGKSLCFIQNFLTGRSLSVEQSPLSANVIYDKDEEFGFEATFYSSDKFYNVKARFISEQLIYESWSIVKMFTSYSYSKVLELLKSNEVLYYDRKNKSEDLVLGMKSAFLSSGSNRTRVVSMFLNNNYYYKYSNENHAVSDSEIDVNFLKKLLVTFDPYITDISTSKDIDGGFVIKLGDKITEVVRLDRKVETPYLSAGTREAIELSLLLYSMYISKHEGVYFIDEQLAYSHSEIEQMILELILTWIDDYDIQVFLTSHNKDLLDVGLPPFNYTFTKKNRYTNEIELIHPEYEVIHNSRSLKNIIKDDIFSTTPNVEELMDLVDKERSLL